MDREGDHRPGMMMPRGSKEGRIERLPELWPGDHFESIKVLPRGKASENSALHRRFHCGGREAPGKPGGDCHSRTGHGAALKLDRACCPSIHWGWWRGHCTVCAVWGHTVTSSCHEWLLLTPSSC